MEDKRQSGNKAGRKPKYSLETLKGIVDSFICENMLYPEMLKERGFYTRLMKFANERGFNIKNIHAFDGDEFRDYLEKKFCWNKPEARPNNTVPGYETINVEHYLKLSKSELKDSLSLLNEKMQNIITACACSINGYKSLEEQNQAFKEAVENLKIELQQLEVKLASKTRECARAKADIGKYRSFIEQNVEPKLIEERLNNSSKASEDDAERQAEYQAEVISAEISLELGASEALPAEEIEEIDSLFI